MGDKPSEKGYLRRAFLALKTDQGQTCLLQPVRDAMPASWKIANPHDDHISLAFIEKMTPEETDRLCSLVRSFAAAAQPFSLSFPMLGTFQNTHPGKEPEDKGKSHIVVYAAPDAASAQKIQSLHYDLAYKVLRPNGFPFGLKNITPHNTLAHIKNAEGERARLESFLDEHHALNVPPAHYTSLVLLDSYAENDPCHPSHHGNAFTKYQVIEEFPFGVGDTQPQP